MATKSPKPSARKAPARKPAATRRSPLGLAAIAGGVVLAGAGLVAAFLRVRHRRTEEHVPVDLMHGPHASPHASPHERAPLAFRPDPTAIPTAAEREALRPATGPAPSMVQDRGTLNGGNAPASG